MMWIDLLQNCNHIISEYVVWIFLYLLDCKYSMYWLKKKLFFEIVVQFAGTYKAYFSQVQPKGT